MERKLFSIVLLSMLLIGPAIAAESGSIQVTAKDSNGDLLSNVRIGVSGPSDTTAYTDSDGKTTIDRLEEGDYTLTASKNDYSQDSASTSLDYNGDTESVTLTLSKSIERGSVTVRVENSKGEAVSNARIDITGPSETTAYTDFDGETTVDRLKKGNYDISVSKDSSNSGTKSFSIDYNEDTETVTLTLETTQDEIERGSVEVTVENNNGDPVSNARIDITGPSETTAFTDFDGKTTVSRLRKGQYEVSARKDGVQSEPKSFSIDYNGDTETVTLTLETTQEPDNQPPTALFTRNAEGLTVKVDASPSVDEDGSIERYEWRWRANGRFRDGSRVDSHTYREPGTYEVTLRVTDNDGATGKKTRSVTVKETGDNPPTASFSVSDLAPEVGEVVSFDASGSSDPDNDIEEFAWDLDEDGFAERFGEQITHTFQSAGKRVVELTVTDSKGNSDTDTREIDVREKQKQESSLKVFVEDIDTGEAVDAEVKVRETFGTEKITKRTGSDGIVTFSLEGDRSYTITAGNDQYFSKTKTRFLEAGSTEETRFRLEKRAEEQPMCNVDVGSMSLSDTSIEPGEEVQAKARVTNNMQVSQEVRVRFDAGFDSQTVTKDLPADSDRVFRSSFTPGEDVTVEMNARGVGDSCDSVVLSTQQRDVTVDTKQEEDARLAVNVVDERGDPVPNARVRVENGDSDREFTDFDGEARFTLEPDNYDITVSKSGFRTEDRGINLEAGDDREITVQLDRTDERDAELNVHVEDTEGNPVRNAEVNVRNGDDRNRFTDFNGEADFTLQPDRYDITVSKSGFQTARRNVDLEPGDDRSITIILDKREGQEADLRVKVRDETGNPVRNAEVNVRNSDDRTRFTDFDGEADFVLDPDNYDITVSKTGFQTARRSVDLDAGDDRTVHVTLLEDGRRDADLNVHVEDTEGDSVSNAHVKVRNGDDETRFTDFNGDASFTLQPDNYDVTVSKTGFQTARRNVDLDPGEEKDIFLILERRDDGGEDDDDRDRVRDVSIDRVQVPASVCRGDSLVTRVTVSNSGDFHEMVTLTGKGLGSISIGNSFTLEQGEKKTRKLIFTNVQGSGQESFRITATNHNSDTVSRTVEVNECPEDRDIGKATDISLRLEPRKTRIGRAVRVSGFVDGIEGRKEVTVKVDGETFAEVNTQPDGYYETYITPDKVGDLTVTASTGSVRESRSLEVLATANVVFAKSPQKVFEGENFKVCGQVESQVTPRVLLMKDDNIVASKNQKGEVCFDRNATGVGVHNYRVVALAHGSKNVASTKTEVLETRVETRNFPDKFASVESGSGIVKATLYNTHRRQTRYDLSLEGLPETWVSQSHKQVVLDPGEEKEVFFYVTPEDEGEFEAELKIDSRGTEVHSQTITISSGGTTKSRKSFVERLMQRLRFL